MTAVRLVAFAANGPSQGPVPAPQSLSVSYPLNDTGALTLAYPSQAPRSNLLGQPMEIATEVSADGGLTWAEPPNGRFLYLQDGRDPVKDDAFQVACPSYIRRLTKALIPFTGLDSEGNRAFTNAKPGAILNTLFSEAQARGALTGLSWDFTATVDSAGLAWPAGSAQTISYAPGTDFLAVLTSMADAGLVDYRTNGRTVQVYVAETFMADDKTDDANRVSVRMGRDLTEAPFRRTWEALADTAYVQGDNLVTLVRTNGAAITPWGRQETFVAASGVTDTGTLTVVADGSLSLTEAARIERTYGLDFTRATYLPFRDYQVGSWVYGSTDGNAPERMRVRQITLAMNDQGVAEGNIVLNDRFLEADILQARKLAKVVGGATLAGAGTPSTGIGNDILAPAATGTVTANTAAYVGQDGYVKAQITLDWADVTTNADGTATTDVDHYEVHRRRSGDPFWALYREVNISQMTDSPYEPNEAWEFKVRAVDGVFNRGGFSPTVAVTTAIDTTPPAQPSQPAASSDVAGVVQVNWDGKTSTGGAMDADLARVQVHMSAVNGFTATANDPATLVGSLTKAGTVAVTDRAKGSTQYVRLLAIDTSGNVSTQSAQRSIVVGTGTDRLAPTIPGGWTPTLEPLGVGALSASWPRVTNPDLVTYDVYVGTAAVDGTAPATFYGSTTADSMPVWNLPDGSPLLSNTGYFLAVKVRDFDGTATGVGQAGPAYVRQADQDLVSADYLYGNKVESKQIKTGTLDAALAIAQEIYTATSGRRISLSSGDGFRAVDQDGNVVMAIPTDLGLDVSINADLVAKSITALGSVAMRSPLNEMAQNSNLILRSGTTAPVTPPTAKIEWNTLRTAPDEAYADLIQGGYFDGTDLIVAEGGWGYFDLWKRSRTTGQRVQKLWSTSGVYNYVARSAVKIGAYYYSLGYYGDRPTKPGQILGARWYVTKWQPPAVVGNAPTRISEWEFSPNADMRDAEPAMGLNGTNVLLVYANSNNGYVVRVQTHNPDTGAAVGSLVDTNITYQGSLASIEQTAADFGAARWVIATKAKTGGDTIWVVNPTTGIRDTNQEWPAVAGDTIGLVAWDSVANMFRQLSSADNLLHTYDGTKWTGAATVTWKATNTWKDTDTTSGSLTHETAQGPPATISMKKRARLTLTAPPIPSDTDDNNHDDPNSVRFYVGTGDGSYSTQFLQASPADGVRVATITQAVFSNADTLHPNPPQFGDFPAGTPAKITSDDQAHYLDGDFKARVRTLFVTEIGAQIEVDGGSYTTVAGSGFIYPTGLAETAFTAPPSGRVLLNYNAYLKANADGTLMGVTLEVRTGNTIRSGTVVHPAALLEGMGNANVQVVRGSLTIPVVGLTPGAAYNVYPAVYRTVASAQCNNTHLKVTPL